MKYLVLILSFVLGSQLLSAADHHSGDESPVLVDDAWARETSPRARAAAVYLTLRYRGENADTLIGVSSDRADMIMIHDTITDGNMSRMREADEIEVSQGDTLRFQPGGRHIMLMGLQSRLVKGDTFEITLHFDKAGDVPVTVDITPVTGPE